MSRSNPEVRLISPAKRFFEWNGDEGGFRYYDKELKEKVKVPLPFTFIVLDCLATVAGFSDFEQSSFWSNEIRKKNIKTDSFTVRSKKGISCEGIWEKIKGKETGMKFCESVYIAFIGENGLEIGNIKMVGACLNAWINYVSGERNDKGKLISSAHDVFKGAITVKSMKEGKKGKTIYQMPVFEPRELKAETEEAVIQMDAELQSYLIEYFAKNASVVTAYTDSVASEETEKTYEPGIGDGRSAKEVAKDKQIAKTQTQEEDDLPF